jgi:hypothetical protein
MQLNKKGEGCIAFTFLRREISPVTHLQIWNLLLLLNVSYKKINTKSEINYDFYPHHQMCNFSFLAINSSTVSRYISSGTQQSTGHTAAHCGSS